MQILARLRAEREATVTTLNLFSVVVSLFLVVILSIDTFQGSESYFSGMYDNVQYYVCLYFLVDFSFLCIISKNRKRFLARYFILVFLSIPYISIIKYYSLSLSDEWHYFLRFMPLIRGTVALAILLGMTTKGKVNSLFISYLTLLFTLCYFLTLIFYFAEYGVNKQVKSYFDALWWAGLSVTTLGPVIIPITSWGKISTFALGVVGMTVFPIFTVYVTSLVQNYNRHTSSKIHADE